MTETLRLDGQSLTIAALVRAAEGRVALTLCPDGLARMAASRDLLLRAIEEGRAIYGVTTGLGARSGERLGVEQLAAFSLDTIRGRAHAVGAPDSDLAVRAAMIVRLNTLLTGHAAASPALAQHLLACLDARLTPVVPSLGSVGVADLTWNATLALALIGEGPIKGPSGEVQPGALALEAAGIAPWHPGPRDGLALVSHSGAVAAAAALALHAARRAYATTQTAAALSMLAFQASLTPFEARVLACNPHPGHALAALGIRQRLAGSALMTGTPPRRLQDPLSIRNLPHLHGTVEAALGFAEAAVTIDLNSSTDNPAALVASDEVLTCGAYFTAHLTNALETVARAFVHMAVAQVARMSKLLNPEFSGLPLFLAATPASNGFAPVMKTAEAVMAELLHVAQPVAVWPSVNANGVEDVLASSPVAARGLARIAMMSQHLTAIEMIVAVQGIDLRGAAATPGPVLRGVFDKVREVSAPLEAARPLGDEIRRLAGLIGAGGFDLLAGAPDQGSPGTL